MFRRVSAPACRALVLQQPRALSLARSYEVAPVYEIVSPWYRSTEILSPFQTLEVSSPLAAVTDGVLATEQQMAADLFSWGPEVKAIGHPDSIDFEVEVPGAKIQELSIDLKDDMLTISGEHEEHNNIAGEDFVCKEDKYGGFMHTITVPSGMRPNMISANLDHGLLVVNVPKIPSLFRHSIAAPTQIIEAPKSPSLLKHSAAAPSQLIHHIEAPVGVDEPVPLLKGEELAAEDIVQICEVLEAMSEAVPVFEERLEVVTI